MDSLGSLKSFLYGFLMLFCIATVGKAFGIQDAIVFSVGFILLIITTKITLPEGRSISPQSEMIRNNLAKESGHRLSVKYEEN